MRTQATCFIQEGDLPIDIQWHKNGLPLDLSNKIRITKVDHLTTILVVDEADEHHSGNYTCLATNAATTVASSAALFVNGEDNDY